MKLKFKKGTQLFSKLVQPDNTTYIPAIGQKLSKDYECKMPECDYTTTIAGPKRIDVHAGPMINYKDDLYLMVGDAINSPFKAKNTKKQLKFLWITIAIIVGIFILYWKK